MIFVGIISSILGAAGLFFYFSIGEITFIDPVPVKPVPVLYLEIPVPVKRTGTVVLEFRFEPELKYSCESIYFTYFHTKTDVIYSFFLTNVPVTLIIPYNNIKLLKGGLNIVRLIPYVPEFKASLPTCLNYIEILCLRLFGIS